MGKFLLLVLKKIFANKKSCLLNHITSLKKIKYFSKVGILINLYNDANEVYFNEIKIGYGG